MATEITSLIVLANLIAFAEIVLFFLIAKYACDILEKLAGKKIPTAERAYCFLAAAFFFLGKLTYMFFLIYGINTSSPESILPNSMFFISGLFLLKGAHRTIEYARGHHD